MTVLDGDRTTEVEAEARDDAILVAPADVERAIGWDLRPEGLCRGDVCVPMRDASALTGDAVDLRRVADTLGRPLATVREPLVAVLADAADELAEARESLTAPPFT